MKTALHVNILWAAYTLQAAVAIISRLYIQAITPTRNILLAVACRLCYKEHKRVLGTQDSLSRGGRM